MSWRVFECLGDNSWRTLPSHLYVDSFPPNEISDFIVPASSVMSDSLLQFPSSFGMYRSNKGLEKQQKIDMQYFFLEE